MSFNLVSAKKKIEFSCYYRFLIVFAGWENKRSTLRRKRQDQELIFTYTDEILTKNCPLKILIEITTG